MDGGVFKKSGIDAGVLGFVHDMKAPISLLRQLGLSLDLEMSDRERRETAREIVATSERALAQVEDLLKVARLDGAMFYTEPVSAISVAAEAAANSKSYFADGALRVKRLAPRGRLVAANRELLGSILGNFLTNAAKHSEEAEIFVKDSGGKTRIGTRDFGPGVSKAIFEAVNGGMKEPLMSATRPGSSGIGLYVAGRFAEFMGGRIGVIRHRDGASFYVELPLSRQMELL
jgi:signal transduction histidine kinase